jgi:hypothetical protein
LLFLYLSAVLFGLNQVKSVMEIMVKKVGTSGSWGINRDSEGGQIWWIYFIYMYEN